MDKAELIVVIRTTLLRRGDGKNRYNPIRVVEQFWSEDGKLLCENDPMAYKGNEKWDVLCDMFDITDPDQIDPVQLRDLIYKTYQDNLESK